MAERGITERMISVAIKKGARYWDPSNKSVCYVVRKRFASGKDLLVGYNPSKGLVTTVVRGKNLVRPRMFPLN